MYGVQKPTLPRWWWCKTLIKEIFFEMISSGWQIKSKFEWWSGRDTPTKEFGDLLHNETIVTIYLSFEHFLLNLLSNPGVLNSWTSGGHIVCWELCRGPHKILSIWRSPLLRAAITVMQPEVKLIPTKNKKGLYLSSISTPSPILPASFFRNRVM